MNYNNILLISEETLKEESLINDNVDSALVLPAIVLATETGLQPAIGTKLLRKVQGLVNDGSISDPVNAKYKELLDIHITNYLCYKVMSEIQIPLNYKFRNNGMVKNQDDKLINTELKDVMFLSTYYNDRADFFLKIMNEYLIANTTYFPEYNQYTFGDGLQSKDATYDCGIYLGPSEKIRRNYY